MTTEIRFIIENKRFKSDSSEYLIFFFAFIFFVVITAGGLYLVVYVEDWLVKLTGLQIGSLGCLATYNLVRRFKQLNKFEGIETSNGQAENYDWMAQLVKTLYPLEVEYDIHNFCISAKVSHFSTFMVDTLRNSGFSSWLTILCLDGKLLINERPEITGLAFWTRSFHKKLKCLILIGIDSQRIESEP